MPPARAAISQQGIEAIVGPVGDVIAGPLVGEPGVLVARLDMRQLRWARRELDGLGHCGRPDVFEGGVPDPVESGEQIGRA